MPADPTVGTHPLLFAVVQQHVEYYFQSEERTSRGSILADLKKDSQYQEMLEEAGLDPTHQNAASAFRQLYWFVVRKYMSPKTGWWARTGGTRAVFFHESWGTPEECRDAVNFRIRQREQDQASLKRLVEITETKCGQLGWSFDAQFDDVGMLVHVDVWKFNAA